MPKAVVDLCDVYACKKRPTKANFRMQPEKRVENLM